jgi:hypothetical protein
MAVIEGDIAIAVPNARFELFQALKQKSPGRVTGAHLPGGQQLPGAKFPEQRFRATWETVREENASAQKS